jgi:hypothetical protein
LVTQRWHTIVAEEDGSIEPSFLGLACFDLKVQQHQIGRNDRELPVGHGRAPSKDALKVMGAAEDASVDAQFDAADVPTALWTTSSIEFSPRRTAPTGNPGQRVRQAGRGEQPRGQP